MIKLIAILTMLTMTPSNDLYVSPSGSDSAGDGSATHPWATLQFAANRAVPGNTVHVASGNYTGFAIQTNGTSTSPITFIADPGVNITSAEPQGSGNGIYILGSWVVVEGFTVTGISQAGISSRLNSNCSILNNTVTDCGRRGIYTSHSDRVLVQGNTCTGAKDGIGIYIANATVSPVIRGNTCANNVTIGIHMNGDISNGGTGLITGALVEKNTILNNGSTGINCDGVQSSKFQNNLIVGNHTKGIAFFRQDAAAGSKNNVVVNNTIYVPANFRSNCIQFKNSSTGGSVFNNILLNDGGGCAIDTDSGSVSGLKSDYNVVTNKFSTNDGTSFLTLTKWRAKGFDKHSVISTTAATFVGNGDFHLSATSPAIDLGNPTYAPPDDLDDNARPVGAGPDSGCYERQ